MFVPILHHSSSPAYLPGAPCARSWYGNILYMHNIIITVRTVTRNRFEVEFEKEWRRQVEVSPIFCGVIVCSKQEAFPPQTKHIRISVSVLLDMAGTKFGSRKLMLIMAFLLINSYSISYFKLSAASSDSSNPTAPFVKGPRTKDVVWLVDSTNGQCLGPHGDFSECGELTLWIWNTLRREFLSSLSPQWKKTQVMYTPSPVNVWAGVDRC